MDMVLVQLAVPRARHQLAGETQALVMSSAEEQQQRQRMLSLGGREAAEEAAAPVRSRNRAQASSCMLEPAMTAAGSATVRATEQKY